MTDLITEIIPHNNKPVLEIVQTTKENVSDAIAWLKGFKAVNDGNHFLFRTKNPVKRGEFQTTSEQYNTHSFDIGDFLAKDDADGVYVIPEPLANILRSMGDQKTTPQTDTPASFTADTNKTPDAGDTTPHAEA